MKHVRESRDLQAGGRLCPKGALQGLVSLQKHTKREQCRAGPLQWPGQRACSDGDSQRERALHRASAWDMVQQREGCPIAPAPLCDAHASHFRLPALVLRDRLHATSDHLSHLGAAHLHLTTRQLTGPASSHSKHPEKHTWEARRSQCSERAP